jgi:hypothetical protein
VFHKNANPQTRTLSPSKDSITFPIHYATYVPTSELRLLPFSLASIIKITNIVALTPGPTAASSQFPLSGQRFLHVKWDQNQGNLRDLLDSSRAHCCCCCCSVHDRAKRAQLQISTVRMRSDLGCHPAVTLSTVSRRKDFNVSWHPIGRCNAIRDQV